VYTYIIYTRDVRSLLACYRYLHRRTDL